MSSLGTYALKKATPRMSIVIGRPSKVLTQMELIVAVDVLLHLHLLL